MDTCLEIEKIGESLGLKKGELLTAIIEPVGTKDFRNHKDLLESFLDKYEGSSDENFSSVYSFVKAKISMYDKVTQAQAGIINVGTNKISEFTAKRIAQQVNVIGDVRSVMLGDLSFDSKKSAIEKIVSRISNAYGKGVALVRNSKLKINGKYNVKGVYKVTNKVAKQLLDDTGIITVITRDGNSYLPKMIGKGEKLPENIVGYQFTKEQLKYIDKKGLNVNIPRIKGQSYDTTQQINSSLQSIVEALRGDKNLEYMVGTSAQMLQNPLKSLDNIKTEEQLNVFVNRLEEMISSVSLNGLSSQRNYIVSLAKTKKKIGDIQAFSSIIGSDLVDDLVKGYRDSIKSTGMLNVSGIVGDGVKAKVLDKMGRNLESFNNAVKDATDKIFGETYDNAKRLIADHSTGMGYAINPSDVRITRGSGGDMSISIPGKNTVTIPKDTSIDSVREKLFKDTIYFNDYGRQYNSSDEGIGYTIDYDITHNSRIAAELVETDLQYKQLTDDAYYEYTRKVEKEYQKIYGSKPIKENTWSGKRAKGLLSFITENSTLIKEYVPALSDLVRGYIGFTGYVKGYIYKGVQKKLGSLFERRYGTMFAKKYIDDDITKFVVDSMYYISRAKETISPSELSNELEIILKEGGSYEEMRLRILRFIHPEKQSIAEEIGRFERNAKYITNALQDKGMDSAAFIGYRLNIAGNTGLIDKIGTMIGARDELVNIISKGKDTADYIIDKVSDRVKLMYDDVYNAKGISVEQYRNAVTDYMLGKKGGNDMSYSFNGIIEELSEYMKLHSKMYDDVLVKYDASIPKVEDELINAFGDSGKRVADDLMGRWDISSQGAWEKGIRKMRSVLNDMLLGYVDVLSPILGGIPINMRATGIAVMNIISGTIEAISKYTLYKDTSKVYSDAIDIFADIYKTRNQEYQVYKNSDGRISAAVTSETEDLFIQNGNNIFVDYLSRDVEDTKGITDWIMSKTYGLIERGAEIIPALAPYIDDKRKLAVMLKGPGALADYVGAIKIGGLKPKLYNFGIEKAGLNVDELDELVRRYKSLDITTASGKAESDLIQNQILGFVGKINSYVDQEYQTFFQSAGGAGFARNGFSRHYMLNYFSSWGTKKSGEYIASGISKVYRNFEYRKRNFGLKDALSNLAGDILTNQQLNSIITSSAKVAQLMYYLDKTEGVNIGDGDGDLKAYLMAGVAMSPLGQGLMSSALTRAPIVGVSSFFNTLEDNTLGVAAMKGLTDFIRQYAMSMNKELGVLSKMISQVIAGGMMGLSSDDMFDVMAKTRQGQMQNSLYYSMVDRVGGINYERLDSSSNGLLDFISGGGITRYKKDSSKFIEAAYLDKLLDDNKDTPLIMLAFSEASKVIEDVFAPLSELKNKTITTENRFMLLEKTLKNDPVLQKIYEGGVNFSQVLTSEDYKKLYDKFSVYGSNKNFDLNKEGNGDNAKFSLLLRKLEDNGIDTTLLFETLDSGKLKDKQELLLKIQSASLGKEGTSMLLGMAMKQEYSNWGKSIKETPEQKSAMQASLMEKYLPLITYVDKAAHADVANYYIKENYKDNKVISTMDSEAAKMFKVFMMTNLVDGQEIDFSDENVRNVLTATTNKYSDTELPGAIVRYSKFVDSLQNSPEAKWAIKGAMLLPVIDKLRTLVKSDADIDDNIESLADILFTAKNEADANEGLMDLIDNTINHSGVGGNTAGGKGSLKGIKMFQDITKGIDYLKKFDKIKDLVYKSAKAKLYNFSLSESDARPTTVRLISSRERTMTARNIITPRVKTSGAKLKPKRSKISTKF